MCRSDTTGTETELVRSSLVFQPISLVPGTNTITDALQSVYHCYHSYTLKYRNGFLSAFQPMSFWCRKIHLSFFVVVVVPDRLWHTHATWWSFHYF